MRIVNKKKFISSVGMLILFITLIIMMILNFINVPEYEETYQKIIVCEDDTLWDIAEKYKKTSQDIREYIYEIKKLNNMESAAIYEGQELTIIIYEEVK